MGTDILQNFEAFWQKHCQIRASGAENCQIFLTIFDFWRQIVTFFLQMRVLWTNLNFIQGSYEVVLRATHPCTLFSRECLPCTCVHPNSLSDDWNLKFRSSGWLFTKHTMKFHFEKLEYNTDNHKAGDHELRTWLFGNICYS